jgi:hypothetical protein
MLIGRRDFFWQPYGKPASWFIGPASLARDVGFLPGGSLRRIGFL